MTRLLYRWLLWLHPPFFRREFAAEMLWIFDNTVESEGAARLLFDGTVSLARQWFLRSGAWKIAAAMAGGLVQVTLGGFGMLLFSQQQMASYVATAPYAGDWAGSLLSSGNAKPIELAMGRNGGAWIGSFITTEPAGPQRSEVLDFQALRDVVSFRVAAPAGEMRFHGTLSGGRLTGTFEDQGETGAWVVARRSGRTAGLSVSTDDVVRITICLVPGVIVAVLLTALWVLGFTQRRIAGNAGCRRLHWQS